jgi:hypothetical protein
MTIAAWIIASSGVLIASAAGLMALSDLAGWKQASNLDVADFQARFQKPEAEQGIEKPTRPTAAREAKEVEPEARLLLGGQRHVSMIEALELDEYAANDQVHKYVNDELTRTIEAHRPRSRRFPRLR